MQVHELNSEYLVSHIKGAISNFGWIQPKLAVFKNSTFSQRFLQKATPTKSVPSSSDSYESFFLGTFFSFVKTKHFVTGVHTEPFRVPQKEQAKERLDLFFPSMTGLLTIQLRLKSMKHTMLGMFLNIMPSEKVY